MPCPIRRPRGLHRGLAWVAAAWLAVPAAGRAEGPFLGAQVGAALPLGNVATTKYGPNLLLRDELRFALPLAAEVGWAFQGPVHVVLYGQYAPGAISRKAPLETSACTSYGAACSRGRWTDLGVRLDFLAPRVGPMWPRLGIGAGYEWVTYGVRDASGSGELAFQGFQAKVQAGADFAAGSRLFVGPALTLSAGRFDKVTVHQGGSSTTGTIGEKALHLWMGLGIQARLEP